MNTHFLTDIFGSAIIAAIVIFSFFVFWVCTIIEIAISQYSDRNLKIVWLLAVIILTWVGLLIYYFVGRRMRVKNKSGYKKFQT